MKPNINTKMLQLKTIAKCTAKTLAEKTESEATITLYNLLAATYEDGINDATKYDDNNE